MAVSPPQAESGVRSIVAQQPAHPLVQGDERRLAEMVADRGECIIPVQRRLEGEVQAGCRRVATVQRVEPAGVEVQYDLVPPQRQPLVDLLHPDVSGARTALDGA